MAAAVGCGPARNISNLSVFVAGIGPEEVDLVETEVAGIQTHQVVSPGTALLMRELLAAVVERGTGTAAAVEGYRVGGKTGTANKLGNDGRYTDDTRASFVGMAPIGDPKFQQSNWWYLRRASFRRDHGAGLAPSRRVL